LGKTTKKEKYNNNLVVNPSISAHVSQLYCATASEEIFQYEDPEMR